MKYFIQQNPQSKYGYELVKVADDGQETVEQLNRKTPDHYLYLPDDVKADTNRTFIGINLLNKTNSYRYELTPKEYRAPRVLGSYTNGEPRKKLEDYLTDDEKAIIEDLMTKAKARREEEAKKAQDPVEKARREYEKALAKYNALMGAQA